LHVKCNVKFENFSREKRELIDQLFPEIKWLLIKI
jgi:hypothetical protein